MRAMTTSVATLALVAGCAAGGAGGAGSSDCRANTPAGASVSWAEDGAPKCAVTVVALRSTQGGNEVLQLQGATLDGGSVAFAVIAFGRALEGTHACSVAGAPASGIVGPPGTVYVDFVHAGSRQSCSITITSGGAVGGAHATGMFSATYTGNGGAAVTAGVFDTPVMEPL